MLHYARNESRCSYAAVGTMSPSIMLCCGVLVSQLACLLSYVVCLCELACVVGIRALESIVVLVVSVTIGSIGSGIGPRIEKRSSGLTDERLRVGDVDGVYYCQTSAFAR
jgi:hypothetical protein